jgi:hypothetical protein
MLTEYINVPENGIIVLDISWGYGKQTALDKLNYLTNYLVQYKPYYSEDMSEEDKYDYQFCLLEIEEKCKFLFDVVKEVTGAKKIEIDFNSERYWSWDGEDDSALESIFVSKNTIKAFIFGGGEYNYHDRDESCDLDICHGYFGHFYGY